MTFTATGNSTTLAFQSLDTGDSGALIADVRVIEIPDAVQRILSNDSTLSYDAATGKFYRAVNTLTNFASAQSAAISSSLNGITGSLVTIGSSYENELIASMSRNMRRDFWLGAQDTITEGTWRWYNGTTAGNTFWIGAAGGTLQAGQYANWSTGEPNDSSNEDYAQIYWVNGLWNDVTAAANMGYVVEWDASEVVSNLTYSLTSNPGGTYAINGNTGEITVANNALLDTKPSPRRTSPSK